MINPLFIISENLPNIISGTEYDYTVQLLGNGWRTPNKEEITELIEKCSWIQQTYKGVTGWQVIGPTNKSIFLPITTSSETETYYLSGQLIKNGYNEGYYIIGTIKLTQDESLIYHIKLGTLGYIRPVKDK